MNIYTVTGDFYTSVRNLFREHKVEVLPHDYQKLSVDLLVFTGGEDIQPSRYNRPDPPHGWFNRERDEWELEVFRNFLSGRFKVKKALGICRGLQLMNVALGGTLVYDIFSKFGQEHGNKHPVIWHVDTVLKEILPEVNSLHHQGIEKVGSKVSRMIFATEPNTKIIEAVRWSNNMFAVQFHPELMGDREKQDKFAKLIEEWVEGKSSLISNESGRSLDEKRKAILRGEYISSFYNLSPAMQEAMQEAQNSVPDWTYEEPNPNADENSEQEDDE